MDGEQKKRILKRYLKDKSTEPEDVKLSDSDLALYADLDKLLDYIDLHKHELFDLATLEVDDKQWTEFTDVLNYASTFTPGSPPTLSTVSTTNADLRVLHWRNAHAIALLPKDNYYNRPTSTPVAVDIEFNTLVGASRAKLYLLLQTVPGATEFNPAHEGQVNDQMTLIKAQIKILTDEQTQKTILQKRLTVLTDLNKINQLARISIPQEHGPALNYCTLAEAAGGVTEKISLIKLATVKLQLSRLNTRDGLTIDNYTTERDQYALSTEAIIKLPKQGKIIEVQHEAIALNIARLIRLDTATSTSISYKNRPALFVPFDTIRLLNEFALGKTFTAGLGIEGQTYTHYSTIKAVGEGIQADRFVNDFGNFLGLLFLSSDTDAIGGYNQNKALRNSRSLFIFDLVMMVDHKFKLDSRLSMEPCQPFFKYTRHGLGRNRTLIEDSSLVSKYTSLIQLIETGDKILLYTNQITKEHHNRTEAIKRQLRGTVSDETRALLTEELKNVEVLEKDAEHIKTTLQERIKQISELFPKTTGVVSSDEIRQALILEKLIHNPVLFSDDARPYKNPWTYRQANTVESITDIGSDSLQITFKAKISGDLVDMIKRHGGGDSMLMALPKIITLSKAHLNALREDMIHPEHTLNLATETDYLATADLTIIKDAYNEGNQVGILKCINDYRTEMNNSDNRDTDKITCISKTESDLKEYIRTAKDKGFGMHILKKFYFDAQLQLQKLMNPLYLPGNLNQAFSAALKLDRISEFNAVVQEAVVQKKLTDSQFTGFLTTCILKETTATNHSLAQIESGALSTAAQRVINHLKLAPSPMTVLLVSPPPASVPDELINIDALAELETGIDLDSWMLINQQVLVSTSKRTLGKEETKPQSSLQHQITILNPLIRHCVTPSSRVRGEEKNEEHNLEEDTIKEAITVTIS